MARERLCRACRQWHPLDAWPAECFPKRSDARSGFPTPMVNFDGLGLRGVKSMVDGRMYDSKSSLRAHYRAAGVVEVGNDGPLVAPPPKRGDPKAAEAAAVKALKETGIWDQLPD